MLSPIEEEPSLEALHPHAPLRAPRPSSGEPLPLPLLRRPGSLSDLLQRSDDMVESLSGEASSRLPRLTLSEALRGGRGSLTASRLSLVEASVTQLDAPPPGLLPNGQLTSLLLSRNALRSLDGLPASLMRGLTTLSLSYNCLADAEALFAHLGRSCPALRALSVEGNPLCALADARAMAFAFLPHLRSLDGRDVLPDEQRAAAAVVAAEHAFFSQLLELTVELAALEEASARRRLLADLRHGPPPPPGTTRRMLQAWEPLRERFAVGEGERRLLRALRCEARRLRLSGESRPLLALEASLQRALRLERETAEADELLDQPPPPPYHRNAPHHSSGSESEVEEAPQPHTPPRNLHQTRLRPVPPPPPPQPAASSPARAAGKLACGSRLFFCVNRQRRVVPSLVCTGVRWNGL